MKLPNITPNMAYGKILKGRSFRTTWTTDYFTNVGEYYSVIALLLIHECDCTAFVTTLPIIDGFRDVAIAFIDYS